MKFIRQGDAIHVAGLELRTCNPDAPRTIPAHWARFMNEAVLDHIPHKLSDDVWAVYTHFEHAGLNNQGVYSLIVGAQVPADGEVPAGLVRAVLPASERAVFNAEAGQPSSVAAVWRRIWALSDLEKTFIADAERYAANGEIEVLIGVKGPSSAG
jgi:predicted transcriptional regulator YdeE